MRPPLRFPIPRACWPHFARDARPERIGLSLLAAAAADIDIETILRQFCAIGRADGQRPPGLLAHGCAESSAVPAQQRSLLAEIPPGKVIVEALDEIIRYQGTQDSHRLCLESALDAPVEIIAAAVVVNCRTGCSDRSVRPSIAWSAQHMADRLGEHFAN